MEDLETIWIRHRQVGEHKVNRCSRLKIIERLATPLCRHDGMTEDAEQSSERFSDA